MKIFKKTKQNNEEIVMKNIFRPSSEIQGQKIEGYDFDNGIEYDGIFGKLHSTGFQATALAKAIDLTNEMIRQKAFVYLGYTSNMVSSGLRDVFRYLVKHNKVNAIVTTAGGIEEDIIKCLGDFVLGDFRASGKELRKKGINRIGNVFVPNNRYVKFEEFFQEILSEIYEEQKKTGNAIKGYELIWKLGERIADETSIYYWAWKNKIKVYCPALLDGAMGDNIYFFNLKHEKFAIDSIGDLKWFNDTTLGLDKSGVIILGSGVVKHSILNANMLRNGADYAVYINNSQEFDGSDAGALPEEAVSWGKILPEAESVKVFGDATILFPLIVAQTFAKK